MVAVKVLVAGASGFVGRRLCPALAETGHDVAATTHNCCYLPSSQNATSA